MVAYGERARRHLGDTNAEGFAADEKTQDGVVRCLAIVGEAAWKMSKGVKAAHPEVPWPLIAGMRHKLVHDYGGGRLGDRVPRCGRARARAGPASAGDPGR
ncbi:MAG: DUF86 domain-containing protein [Planctomycetes bacterium]|nr:DUF86 domain-containing protein [Planctomycetota bacterium]